MSGLSYEELAAKYPETVVIRLQGTFYKAFGNSAFVLNVLFHYSVCKMQSGKKRVGFPKSGLAKVLTGLDENKVNVIVFEGEKEVGRGEYANNQFNTVLARFSESNIEDKTTLVNKKSVPEHTEEDKEKPVCPVSGKQRVSFVQGQGISLENAIMDVQRAVERLMETGKKIISFSFIENRETERKDAVLVQGLVVYEILTEE